MGDGYEFRHFLSTFRFVDHLHKSVEHVLVVEGARGRFRMVLDGHYRKRLVSNALDGVVVQVDVADLDLRRERIRIDREAMILGGDMDETGLQVLDRVVRAPVPGT